MPEVNFKFESEQEGLILLGIHRELRKAEKKHPDWSNHDLFHQVVIMHEEAGEVAKAAIDFHNGTGTIHEFKEELMQTAAMCMRILKNLNHEEKS